MTQFFYIIATGADNVGTWRAMSDCCGERSDGDYPDVACHNAVQIKLTGKKNDVPNRFKFYRYLQ